VEGEDQMTAADYAQYALLGLAAVMTFTWRRTGKRHEWLASGGLFLLWLSLIISIARLPGDPSVPLLILNPALLVFMWIVTRVYLKARDARRQEERPRSC
jgi:hypothetical protein